MNCDYCAGQGSVVKNKPSELVEIERDVTQRTGCFHTSGKLRAKLSGMIPPKTLMNWPAKGVASSAMSSKWGTLS